MGAWRGAGAVAGVVVALLAGGRAFAAQHEVNGSAILDTDPVVATVNARAVRLSDVENARNLLPPRLQGAPLREVYPLLMESLINSSLAAARARALGFKDSAEYRLRMARISDQILERILLARYIEQRLSDDVIKKRYDQVVAQAKSQFEMRVRHILLKTRAQAQNMIDQLDGGADFAALASAYSVGPSKARGGELGWLGLGQTVAEFETAAAALDIGDFTRTPVQSKFGWHVILLQERRPMSIPSYQEAREILANELSAELGQTYMEQLRADAKITKKSFAEVVEALQK